MRLTLVAWGRQSAMEAVVPAIPEEGRCLVGLTDAFGECLHRVQAERPGLVEWWENRPQGLEHGFVVEPAEGEGALVFELQISGAAVEIDGDEAILRREAGEALRCSGLVAWDETGRTLPAWLEEGDQGVAIVVDDEGAIGAITVDPLLTTAAWTAETDQVRASLGISVASAGDVNGDGFTDIVVGAPQGPHAVVACAALRPLVRMGVADLGARARRGLTVGVTLGVLALTGARVQTGEAARLELDAQHLPVAAVDFAGAATSLHRYLELHPVGRDVAETQEIIAALKKRGAWSD